MAEIILGPIIDVLIQKLASGDLMKLARYEGIASQLEKWNNTLPKIQALLVDAENKHITDTAVDFWLCNLQDLTYDIDDIVDDMATEVMRRQLNKESHASSSTNASKLLKFIPTCCTNVTPRTIIYGHQMTAKLDQITTKLHTLFEQKNTLGLDTNGNVKRSNRAYKRLEETSLVEESDVMGREGDKKSLLEKLLGNEACNKNVSIVSIVGLGGIGKTALAKVLYNEDKVKDHFELRAWVCVSEDFDVFNISNAIFQAVDGNRQEFANLDLLHVVLKEKLSNKRFLVVLDDLWNQDPRKWELLRRPFVEGAPGSKILVTTRKTKVALVMGSLQPYDLEALTEEKALSLLARSALDEHNFDKYPKLKLYGEGIVKKCGRLPLALITLGRALRTKTEADEWEEVLNSEIWDLQDENDILPALRLSYYDLPSHLRQLFAYCSLFPKDYMFDKKKLVLLWMAQGFLNQSKGRKSKESLGYEYFEELKSRSFFQTSTNYDYEQSGYIMHDLINDLATSVAGQFFFRLDDKLDAYDENISFEKFRHVSFIGPEYGTYRKFKELQRARGLRTFILVSLNSWSSFNLSNNVLAELLPKLQFVRVLSLSYHSITEVPQSIGSLKHIRYLNFSGTNIERLPEQVSDLYNLQSLLVSGCYELFSLPASFAKLINLRHLDINDTPKLKKMPLGSGGLMGLQTLNKVIIEGGNGFKIFELKSLSNLQGELSIMGLDKVTSPIQENDAKLHEKKGIDDLVMRWSEEFDDSRDQMIEYKVLEGLRPHHKLRKLEILFYGGMKFPSWVGDPSFDKLTKLTLHGCRRCTHLPAALGAVEDLSIIECDELRYLCESKSEEACNFLVSLRKLKIRECKKLLSLGEKGVNVEIRMKNVRQVHISHCESLESYNCPNSVERLMIINCDSLTFSTISSLKTLLVEDCDNLEYISDKGFGIIPLEYLQISNGKNLKLLPYEHLETLTSLKHMFISNCPSMDYSFPCGLWPPNLRKLWIGGLKKPMSEWGIQNYPTSLVELELYGKNSGVVSFVANAKDVTFSSFLLPPSLTSLEIHDFMDVESVSEVLQHLPCLKQLYISSCPKLKDIPETDTTDPSSLKITVRP